MSQMNINNVTPQQLMAFFESAINELKAKGVAPGCDVDGRSGYVVAVDHVIFCALLREEKIFMELNQSLVLIRREGYPDETRPAMYYGPLCLFVLVP